MGTHLLENEEGQVRATKESERGGTHFLESAETGTGQDSERKCACEGLSLPEEHKRWDKSGH
jgi:hypothetical protein